MLTVPQSGDLMSADGLRACEVTTRALHREFCDFPFRLYRSDPCWVAPPRSLELERWSPERNTSLRRRWHRRFVVHGPNGVLGRVAAIIDEEFCHRWGAGSGFFGFFECVNDPYVAEALIGAVERALGPEHRSCLLGPINLSTQDEVGLLVENDGTPPMVLSPYNPPYYERLLTGLGFMPSCDYHAFEWAPGRPHSPAVDRLLRRYPGPRRLPSGVAIRSADPRRWAEECRLIFELYNASFAGTWGFVPLTWEEFEDRARRFRPFYAPELVLFAEQAGRPVGFSLMLPDVNAALAQAAGWPGPLFWARLAFGAHRIRQARIVLMGVLPQATGNGVAALLAQESAVRADWAGLRRVELSLVRRDNHRMRHVIEAFGARPCKTYRLYQKPIQPAETARPAANHCQSSP